MSPATPRLWLPLGRAGEVEGLGGKAASLDRLHQLELPVPPGFVLPAAAFFTWLGSAGLTPGLEALRSRVAAGEEIPPGDPQRLAFVRAAEDAPLPEPIREALAAGRESLGDGGLFAVRSSGNLEDSPDASCAGLYETFLDVLPAEVEGAVRRCWISLVSDRSLAYLRHLTGRVMDLSMAVVVQVMVPGAFSGVCFTVDPLTGRDDQLLVELVPGRGDRLVSGRTNPSRLRFPYPGGAPEADFDEEIPPSARAALVGRLQEELLPRVRELARAEGFPLDIEFVLDEEETWLVQARPVTRIHFSPDIGEWTSADFNEGGVSSGVCSPFMWSLYDFIWRNTMPEYLHRIGLLPDRHRPVRWARVFFGVPYWNVGEVKRCLHKVPGFDEQNFDEDLGIDKDYGGDPWRTPTNLRTLLGALPVLFFMYREFGRQRALARQLLEEFPRRVGYYLSVDLEAASDEIFTEAFRKLVLEDYAWVEGTYFMTIFNSSNAKLEFKSALDAQAARVPGGLSYLDLMSGMRGLRTLASVHDLHHLAARLHREPAWREAVLSREGEELEQAFREGRNHAEPWISVAGYLEEHAHHSVRELDLRVPRWGEDVSFVLEQVRRSLRDFDPSRDPGEVEERQYRRYRAERERALASFGWRLPSRLLFSLALDRTREYCWLREEVRDRSTRLYRVIRRYTLEMGRRLVARGVLEEVEDIFLLPFRSCLDSILGRETTAQVRERVEGSRDLLLRFRHFQAPREVGARFRPRAPVREVGDQEALQGVGGAPGCVRGRVRFLPDPTHGAELEPGEILVAEFTDPGWTPLLEHVGGVVTEVGGVLSHAAVISREYGVPAVLSVRHATRLLRDGMLVEVDGDRGEVRILSS